MDLQKQKSNTACVCSKNSFRALKRVSVFETSLKRWLLMDSCCVKWEERCWTSGRIDLWPLIRWLKVWIRGGFCGCWSASPNVWLQIRCWVSIQADVTCLYFVSYISQYLCVLSAISSIQLVHLSAVSVTFIAFEIFKLWFGWN